MKQSSKVLILLAGVVVLLAMTSSSALAQCAAARIFGGGGGAMGTAKINIDYQTAGLNDLAAVGVFWEDGNPTNNSASGITCPISQYWGAGTVVGTRKIDGAMSTPTCQMGMCPATGSVMDHVVEAPSNDGKSAGWVFYQIKETPAAFRWWDHALTGTVGQTVTHQMVRYPNVMVTGSTGPPPGTTLTSDFVNLALGYHGHIGAPVPASTGIDSYDIVAHQGDTRPPVQRSAFNLGTIKTIPYADNAVVGSQVTVPCPNSALDTWVAVCATFNDGVQSTLCGAATAVECDPAIADEDKPKLKRALQHQKPVGRQGR